MFSHCALRRHHCRRSTHPFLSSFISVGSYPTLPVADPFKSEKLHSGTGAKLVCAVVADLYDVAAFVTSEPFGLNLQIGAAVLLNRLYGVIMNK